jgi:hypothetical protein
MVTTRGFDARTLLLDRARDKKLSLRAAIDAIEEIPEPLRGRMAGGLRNEISRAMENLDSELLDPLKHQTLHPGDAWARMHATDWTVEALLSETLQLVSGAVIRCSDKTDWSWRNHISQFCSFADDIADEIASRTPIGRWESFTVPGLVDQFEYESRLITVPFARPSLWSLPTTAHEFGHHAARSIHRFVAGKSRNLLDELHESLPASASWYWVEELFADAFASWTMGPAYGLACLTLAFDPVTARRGSPTHPPDSTRVELICDVLAAFPDDAVEWLGRGLAEAWRGLLEASEADSQAVEGIDEAPPAEWFTNLVGLLQERLPYARYSSADRATELVDKGFGDDAWEPPASAIDIVNAAWMARVNAGSFISLGEIHWGAVKFMQNVVGKV